MADELSNPTVMTAEGLVIKNLAKAEGIDAPREFRTEAVLHSWECDRILRRDFHLITPKIFKALCARDDWRKPHIRSMLKDIQLAAETFEANCRPYPVTRQYDPSQLRRLPIRIICAEANWLYQAFLTVDQCMLRLSCAVVDGKMSLDQRRQMFRAFEVVYADLKGLVIHNRQPAGTADQLASQLGVE